MSLPPLEAVLFRQNRVPEEEQDISHPRLRRITKGWMGRVFLRDTSGPSWFTVAKMQLRVLGQFSISFPSGSGISMPQQPEK